MAGISQHDGRERGTGRQRPRSNRSGPWYNALGDRIAVNVEDLHNSKNAINRDSAVTERGDSVDTSKHDILTAHGPTGRRFRRSRI